MLTALFVIARIPDGALSVVEVGRARAPADLMSAQYSAENQVSVDIQSWVGIARIMEKENECTCLYISYFRSIVFLWIDCFNNEGPAVKRNVAEVFGYETFRKFYNSPEMRFEDRSLFSSNAIHPIPESSQKDDLAALRPSLAQCYKMLIAPVADLLGEAELIIVPDRHLYKVPFPALSNENGKLLSETFRIRIVPSLMTLKLIQDCPADYHNQTDVLIVGEPKVDQMFYNVRIENLCSLTAARKEAEMIGRLLGAQPLLGQQAT